MPAAGASIALSLSVLMAAGILARVLGILAGAAAFLPEVSLRIRAALAVAITAVALPAALATQGAEPAASLAGSAAAFVLVGEAVVGLALGAALAALVSAGGWAGGVLGSKEHINTIRSMRNTIGTICDPNTAWMLLRSLETLELRMSRAGENAAKVCAFLRQHPKVDSMGYLGFIEDARQKDIYDRHCKGAGSTFSLLLKGGEAECFRFLDALRIAKLAVSLGGTETLASHPASMTHLSVPDARKAAYDVLDRAAVAEFAGSAAVATDATTDRWARIAPPEDLPVPLHGE